MITVWRRWLKIISLANLENHRTSHPPLIEFFWAENIWKACIVLQWILQLSDRRYSSSLCYQSWVPKLSLPDEARIEPQIILFTKDRIKWFSGEHNQHIELCNAFLVVSATNWTFSSSMEGYKGNVTSLAATSSVSGKNILGYIFW